MLDFIQNFNLQEVISYLSANPHIIGIFTYCIVFLEALAVVGAIVPGVIVMPAIGFLIGSSVVPAGTILLCAVTGAVTGDCLSFFIGSYFKDSIPRIWPFTRWPNLITQSEKFFENHGGKSIVIGRFAGPTRAMIPMIAGMFKMHFLRFFCISVPSAAFWAVSYITPGILLGALSLELPPKVAAKFALGGLLGFISIWFIFWLVRHFFRQTWRLVDRGVTRVWKYFKKHKESSWFTKLLSDPKVPDNHCQLTLLFIAFFFFLLFLYVLHQVLISGWLVDVSHAIYHLLRSLRSHHLQSFLTIITFLGDIKMLMVAFSLIFLWLIKDKDWYVAAHLLGIMLAIGFVLVGIKYFMHHSRPGDILYEIEKSSFPSAHVAFSLSFYGFLSVILAREMKAIWRYMVYSVVGILVGLVAFSRLYLGAHWFTDILAGAFLGGFILLIAVVLYRRKHIVHFKARRFATVILSCIFAVWIGYSMLEYKKMISQYDLVWPKQLLTFSGIVKSDSDKLPLYRLNRLGKPIDALNVIYLGDLAKIKTALSKNDWEPHPVDMNFPTIVASFLTNTVAHHLSIFPHLYHNKKAALLFTKSTDKKDVILILRLWASGVDLEDGKAPLWIGEVEYNHAKPSMFSIEHYQLETNFTGATDDLAKHLSKGFRMWKKEVPLKDQPAEMQGLKWNGKLLIIKAN